MTSLWPSLASSATKKYTYFFEFENTWLHFRISLTNYFLKQKISTHIYIFWFFKLFWWMGDFRKMYRFRILSRVQDFENCCSRFIFLNWHPSERIQPLATTFAMRIGLTQVEVTYSLTPVEHGWISLITCGSSALNYYTATATVDL